MLIGYARVSKADGAQCLDLQTDALAAAGVEAGRIYSDRASGKSDARPGLDACLRSLRPEDALVVWKLDRLGRDLAHLVETVRRLEQRGADLRVLTGKGANLDTGTPAGKLVFGIFAALAEFERELIRERTAAGLAAARTRGRIGGRRLRLGKEQVRMAQAAMRAGNGEILEICAGLGIGRATLYRYVGPDGELREHGRRALGRPAR